MAVDRFALAIRRSGDGFLRRVFTAAEIAQCGGGSERLAGRWAAKEAVIKCFDGTGVCFPRRRIEVLAGASGAPRVRLIGPAPGVSLEVSITHHGGFAIATAMLEMTPAADMPLIAPDAVTIPARPRSAHKGTFGSVAVLAGSLGLTGAAYLCATAAARGGAGTVRLLVAEGIYPILAAKCTEVMATPIAEVAPGAAGHSAHEAVMRHLTGTTAAVVGPGLGRDSSTWRLVYDLILHSGRPMVLDADALNALAENPRVLRRLGDDRILTPHPSEMARLCHIQVDDVQKDRQGYAARAAREWGAVIVLKGARTVVAAPDGRISENPHEVAALATGGTGDVLAGLIGALLAQGSDPFSAAVTGVYVHGEAGRRVSSRVGESGLLASDLLGEIPVVMQVLRSGGL